MIAWKEIIKKIQLDAMKEGMRRAARMMNFLKTNLQNNADIHTAAEQLTERDLA
jgi:hypothetical protein